MGFRVTLKNKDKTEQFDEKASTCCIGGINLEYIVSEDILVSQSEDHFALFDGLPLTFSLNSFVTLLKNEGIECLKRLHGQFSGFILTNSQAPIAFTDRFTTRPLIFNQLNSGLEVCSHWTMLSEFHPEQGWNLAGLAETFQYRTLSHKNSLIPGTFLCPAFHYAVINADFSTEFNDIWSIPAPGHEKSYSNSHQINRVRNEILRQYNEVKQDYQTVAVLLSGGIDSFILAALAKQVFDTVIAYTPYWTEGDNPELENAKKHAETLGLEHKLIKVEPSEIEGRLENMIETMGAAVRNYSSLVLDIVFEAIDADIQLVLYGQAADTIFGNEDIKSKVIDSKLVYVANLIPVTVLNLLKKASRKFEILLKLRALTNFTMAESISSIFHSTKSYEFIRKVAPFDSLMDDRWSKLNKHDELKWKAQSVIMSAECAQHFREIGAAAKSHGKKFLVPFVSEEMLSISQGLTYSQYFGSVLAHWLPLSMYDSRLMTKPILRSLAIEYCSEELINRHKTSFPVPLIEWMKGPLKENTEEALKASLFNHTLDESYTLQNSHELIWTLINLNILDKAFNKWRTPQINTSNPKVAPSQAC